MNTEGTVHRASQWCYRGVWSMVTKWMHVPPTPPELTGADDLRIQAFRPAAGYLNYRKLFFWIGLTVIDVSLVTLWIILLVTVPLAGVLLAIPFWILIIVPDILVYIGLHLRYDTTWYVLSDRTLRIRRGIWSIHEVTITYENIQNVSIKQGPIQRIFGISDVLVETAGGGGHTGAHGQQSLGGHQGLIEGIDSPVKVRDLIMSKWRAAKSAGLGDDGLDEHPDSYNQSSADRLRAAQQLESTPGSSFGTAEQQVLQQIRNLAVALAKT